MRKSLYYNCEYYNAVGDTDLDMDEELLKYHVCKLPGCFRPFNNTVLVSTDACRAAHCLDTVRQVLVCNVETGVLGQVWTRTSKNKSPQAFPDFNTRHVCKDYEAVRRWAEAHRVPPNEQFFQRGSLLQRQQCKKEALCWYC